MNLQNQLYQLKLQMQQMLEEKEKPTASPAMSQKSAKSANLGLAAGVKTLDQSKTPSEPSFNLSKTEQSR